MELGEGSATVTEPPEPAPPESQHVRIRFCLFFDGTLNNRININQRLLASSDDRLTAEERRAAAELRRRATDRDIEQARQIYARHGAKRDDEENSYEGFYTNIEKLHTYLDVGPGKTPGYPYAFAVYIEGAGTLDKEGDLMAGYAFGASFLKWKAGIPDKVARGIEKIVENIRGQDKIIEGITIIDELCLDVFGFSRGAAAARNFIYEALNDDLGPKQTPSVQTRLRHEMFRADAVKVKFAGLFDTVSTYGSGVAGKVRVVFGSADNVEELNLDAVGSAEQVLHLTAADEHRFHFSLTGIESAGERGREYCLPGSHSDVGGGYRDEQPERLVLRGSPKIKDVILQGNHARLDEVEQDRLRLLDAGWYTDEELEFQVLAGAEAAYGRLTTIVERPRIVRNHYSRIPLHIMAAEMRRQGLQFLEDRFEELEKVPEDDALLQFAKQKLEAHCTGPSKPDPDFWRNNREPWLKRLRHDYLHFSARMQIGHDPRIEQGERRRDKYPG